MRAEDDWMRPLAFTLAVALLLFPTVTPGSALRAGMLADMVLVDRNPLEHFKVLYGTGAMKLNDQTGRGVKFTIKDGIVYDARQLLADVAAMVARTRVEDGTTPRSRR